VKIVAVIPCYNEARTITEIVDEAKRYVDEVIVADDSSSDETVAKARAAGAKVICNSNSHRGTGANTKRGMSVVDADIIVTLDGDGQHLPNEISSVLAPLLSGEADLVIGSRFMGEYKIARYRKFGIDVITFLYNFGRRQKVVDSQSCFRAFTRGLLDSVNIEERGFGFSTEFLIKARARGYKIVEVPITCVYHKEYAQNSSSNPVIHGLSVAWATIKWRIKEELLRHERLGQRRKFEV